MSNMGMSVMLNSNKLPATSHTSDADKLFQLACGPVIYLNKDIHDHLILPDVLQAQLE